MYFETGHTRLTESFTTDEVSAYIEAMKNVERSVKNTRAIARVFFCISTRKIHLHGPLQRFLHLVLEAAFARDLCFHIVAPNLRISANLWRSCKTSYPTFLAEKSKALQAYTGYKGNSQMLVDKATAIDFGRQMAHRSFDENGVRHVSDTT